MGPNRLHFTSLKADLCQYTNRGFGISRCLLTEHFLEGSALLQRNVPYAFLLNEETLFMS